MIPLSFGNNANPARRFRAPGGVRATSTAPRRDRRRTADFVDKILRGSRPADLPVEQPVKFDLVVNLKTAQGLGVAIPPTLLARADEVIE